MGQQSPSRKQIMGVIWTSLDLFHASCRNTFSSQLYTVPHCVSVLHWSARIKLTYINQAFLSSNWLKVNFSFVVLVIIIIIPRNRVYGFWIQFRRYSTVMYVNESLFGLVPQKVLTDECFVAAVSCEKAWLITRRKGKTLRYSHNGFNVPLSFEYKKNGVCIGCVKSRIHVLRVSAPSMKILSQFLNRIF